MTEETQQMEVVPLLPCPLCGKDARYVPADYIDGMGEPWPFAECDPCNVGAPVEFWNKRTNNGRGEVVAWSYCPECDCEELHHEVGEHKQCANCHQEWFSDIDYSDVVRGNLQKLKASQPAPVAVVMPGRLAIQSHWPEWKISGSEGWNACLDEVARLNSEPKP